MKFSTPPASSTASAFTTSMLVLFCSAAAALMYEVVATAAVFFYYPESSYSVATVLSIFLMGLGVGSLGIHVLRKRILHPAYLLGIIQLLVGAYGYFILKNLLYIGDTWSGLTLLGLSAVLLLIPAIFLGATFPLAILVSQKKSSAIGLMYAIDLAGAISGSIVAGLWLIPTWGYAATIAAASLLNIVASIFILKKMARILPVALVGIIVVVLVLEPAPATLTTTDHQDITTTSPFGTVSINNNILSIDTREQCAYGQADITTERQILNHALLDLPRESTLTLLNIGLGCANTATQALRWPNAEITVVEINPIIIELTKERVPQLQSPRVHIIENDGLAYARTASETFDAITIDIENPAVAHSSALYTLEAFQVFADHLADNGRLALWNYEGSSAQPERYRDIIAYSLAEALPYVYHSSGFFVASRQPLSLEQYTPTSLYEINTVDHPTLTEAYLGK